MKRTSFYIILSLAVLLTAIVVFWVYSAKSLAERNLMKSAATNNLASNANAPAVNSQISTGQSNQSLPTRAEIDAIQEQTLQKIITSTREQSAKMVADRSKPIAFYGKVVDEETQAVASAGIHFIWVDPVSTSASDTASAADGSFSLTGVVGGDVSVYVSKAGYDEIKSQDKITFNNTGDGSSQDNPVLFHLRKKGTGADLITSKNGMKKYLGVSMPLDGSPVNVNLLVRSVGQDGQLLLSQIKPAYENWKQATEWSFKMEIPDGGFVEENDEFPFEAPESGYQSTVEFKFQQGQPNWTKDELQDYYIKFGNPPRYGHLHLDTSIDMSGARLTYAINPDGSRYLEPKSSNP
jgi:hypothetical protein